MNQHKSYCGLERPFTTRWAIGVPWTGTRALEQRSLGHPQLRDGDDDVAATSCATLHCLAMQKSIRGNLYLIICERRSHTQNEEQLVTLGLMENYIFRVIFFEVQEK